MITCYISNINCLRVYYLEGVFLCMEMDGEDKILFDVLRHDIEIYEHDVNLLRFRKVLVPTLQEAILKLSKK
jgi:hypothetical protein